MNATLTKAVYLFAAPLSQSARLIEALRAKREAEGPQDATPQDATPQDAAPQDAAPQDAAAESTTPEDAAAPAVESTPQDVATGGDTA
jgi:large subunit ribosomal protein L10